MSGQDHGAGPRHPAPGTEVAARSCYPDSDEGPCRGVVLAVGDLAALDHTPPHDRGSLREMTPVRWDGEEIRWERTADLQPYAEAMAAWERDTGGPGPTPGLAGLAERLVPTQERTR